MLLAQIGPTPYDRLGLTVSVAILIHALIVFGISFAKEDRPNTRLNTMEIILVNQETKEPEESSVLAQKNLEGGGEAEEITEPMTSIESNFSELVQQAIEKPSVEGELLQNHDIEVNKIEVPEILDVNKENIETIAVKDVENEVIDLVSEKQKPDFIYEKLDELDIKKKIAKNPSPTVIPTSEELLSNSFEIASSNNEVRRKMIERKNAQKENLFLLALKNMNMQHIWIHGEEK